MDSNHIHIFLEKILATANCPKCKKKIGVQDISIQSMTNKTCVFSIHCPACGSNSLAQAVVNILSQKKHTKDLTKAKKEISTEEIVSMHRILSNSDSKDFSSFFKKT